MYLYWSIAFVFKLFQISLYLTNLSFFDRQTDRPTKKGDLWSSFPELKKSYKKINLNALKEDDCSLKPYFMKLKVEDARLRFKLASNMTPTVAMNFQSERKFIARLWSCPSCFVDDDKNARDTQQHILICKAYANLRIGRDLTNDKDLVDYMRNVINLRLLL